MKLLFVHRAFPGQFVNLIKPLRSRGDYIIALGENNLVNSKQQALADKFIGYEVLKGNTPNIPAGLLDVESKVLRAKAAAKSLEKYIDNGLNPDLIITHSGWGESIFLGHIFPNIPQIHFLEYYYGAKEGDMAFEDILMKDRKTYGFNWRTMALAQIKSFPLLSSLESMTWGVAPTKFQLSQFPKRIQEKSSVIHDGIDVQFAKPNNSASFDLPNGLTLNYGDQVITFVNRTFEPYRGIHVFLKSLIDIQRQNPKVQTILVGKDTPNVSYGAHRDDGKGWLTFLKEEIGNDLDWSRIHSIGCIKHSSLINLFQITSAHVYLTYPFVLSWSMLEAMSCGSIVIGSRTKPVEEVITHSKNGFLVDFSDTELLAKQILYVLDNQDKCTSIRDSARQTVLEKYERNTCIRSRISMIDKILTLNSAKNQID